jgi:uncharacterized membrane protein YccC
MSKTRRPKVKDSDPYLEKIIKFIPTDIVAAYVVASGLVKMIPTQERQVLWSWIVAIALLIATPFWLLQTTGGTTSKGCVRTAIAGTIAFAAWVFATGGPFDAFEIQPGKGGWYCRAIGSIVMILIYILILPLFAKGLHASDYREQA